MVVVFVAVFEKRGVLQLLPEGLIRVGGVLVVLAQHGQGFGFEKLGGVLQVLKTIGLEHEDRCRDPL